METKIDRYSEKSLDQISLERYRIKKDKLKKVRLKKQNLIIKIEWFRNHYNNPFYTQTSICQMIIVIVAQQSLV